uniref:Uncharacterized protein n=1 Tax=Arundo donax TaxID=35708 RepID=A0A0A8ZBV6_ARUDO
MVLASISISYFKLAIFTFSVLWYYCKLLCNPITKPIFMFNLKFPTCYRMLLVEPS